MYQVKDWMTPDPVTIEPGAPVREALSKLQEGAFRHLPVVSGGRCVGVVSARDLQHAFPTWESGDRADVATRGGASLIELARRSEAGACFVGEVMTYGPTTVPPEMPLASAVQILDDLGLGCVLVAREDEHLIGILTNGDAIAALVAFLRGGETRAQRLGEVEGLVRQLKAERRRMLEELRAREAAERSLSQDVTEEPRDPSDRGAAFSELEVQGTLAELAAHRLVEIDRALERYARGALGTCAGCGRRIGIARLRARPGTDACIRCARRLSRAPSRSMQGEAVP